MAGSDGGEDGAVAVIAVGGDAAGFDSLFYAAPRLPNVEAIIELALPREGTHFRVIAGEFLFGDIYQSKFAHPGSIDDRAAAGEVEHFRKSGGMDALAAPAADILGL